MKPNRRSFPAFGAASDAADRAHVRWVLAGCPDTGLEARMSDVTDEAARKIHSWILRGGK